MGFRVLINEKHFPDDEQLDADAKNSSNGYGHEVGSVNEGLEYVRRWLPDARMSVPALELSDGAGKAYMVFKDEASFLRASIADELETNSRDLFNLADACILEE